MSVRQSNRRTTTTIPTCLALAALTLAACSKGKPSGPGALPEGGMPEGGIEGTSQGLIEGRFVEVEGTAFSTEWVLRFASGETTGLNTGLQEVPAKIAEEWLSIACTRSLNEPSDLFEEEYTVGYHENAPNQFREEVLVESRCSDTGGRRFELSSETDSVIKVIGVETVGNEARARMMMCVGHLAAQAAGSVRPMYLTLEEESGNEISLRWTEKASEESFFGMQPPSASSSASLALIATKNFREAAALLTETLFECPSEALAFEIDSGRWDAFLAANLADALTSMEEAAHKANEYVQASAAAKRSTQPDIQIARQMAWRQRRDSRLEGFNLFLPVSENMYQPTICDGVSRHPKCGKPCDFWRNQCEHAELKCEDDPNDDQPDTRVCVPAGESLFPVVTATAQSQSDKRAEELIRSSRINPCMEGDANICDPSLPLVADKFELADNLWHAFNEDLDGAYADMAGGLSFIKNLGISPDELERAARRIVQTSTVLGRPIYPVPRQRSAACEDTEECQQSCPCETEGLVCEADVCVAAYTGPQRVHGTEASLAPVDPWYLAAQASRPAISNSFTLHRVLRLGIFETIAFFRHWKRVGSAALSSQAERTLDSLDGWAATLVDRQLQANVIMQDDSLDIRLFQELPESWEEAPIDEDTVTDVEADADLIVTDASITGEVQERYDVWFGELGRLCAYSGGSVPDVDCNFYRAAEDHFTIADSRFRGLTSTSISGGPRTRVVYLRTDGRMTGNPLSLPTELGQEFNVYVSEMVDGEPQVIAGFSMAAQRNSTYRQRRFSLGSAVEEAIYDSLAVDPQEPEDSAMSCAGLPTNVKVKLEDELTEALTGRDGIESSFRYYLDLAQDAARVADDLGDRLVEQGLQMDMRAEAAREELEDLCGGVINVGRLEEAACERFNCDLSKLLAAAVEADKAGEPSPVNNPEVSSELSGLMSCLGYGPESDLDWAAVGDRELCIWQYQPATGAKPKPCTVATNANGEIPGIRPDPNGPPLACPVRHDCEGNDLPQGCTCGQILARDLGVESMPMVGDDEAVGKYAARRVSRTLNLRASRYSGREEGKPNACEAIQRAARDRSRGVEDGGRFERLRGALGFLEESALRKIAEKVGFETTEYGLGTVTLAGVPWIQLSNDSGAPALPQEVGWPAYEPAANDGEQPAIHASADAALCDESEGRDLLCGGLGPSPSLTDAVGVLREWRGLRNRLQDAVRAMKAISGADFSNFQITEAVTIPDAALGLVDAATRGDVHFGEGLPGWYRDPVYDHLGWDYSGILPIIYPDRVCLPSPSGHSCLVRRVGDPADALVASSFWPRMLPDVINGREDWLKPVPIPFELSRGGPKPGTYSIDVDEDELPEIVRVGSYLNSEGTPIWGSPWRGHLTADEATAVYEACAAGSYGERDGREMVTVYPDGREHRAFFPPLCVDSNLPQGVRPCRESPRICNKVREFTIAVANPWGRHFEHGEIMDALSLACAAKFQAGTTCETLRSTPVKPGSVESLPRLAQRLRCSADSVEDKLEQMFVVDVPASLVDVISKGAVAQTFPDAQGEYGVSISTLASQLLGLQSLTDGVVQTVRDMAQDIERAQLTLAQLDLHSDINNIDGILAGLDHDDAQLQGAVSRLRTQQAISSNKFRCAVSTLQAVASGITAVGNSSNIKSGVGAAAAAVYGAASATECAGLKVQSNYERQVSGLSDKQLENATKRYELILEQLDAGEQLTEVDKQLALLAVSEKFTEKSDRVHSTLKELYELQAQIHGTLSKMDQQRNAARRAAAKVLMLDSDDVGRQYAVNSAMRARMNTLRVRYERARANAIRMAYLARRSIEQRMGVDLSLMERDMSLVEAPKTWADTLCTLSGIDYEEIRTGGRASSEGDAPDEGETLSADYNYADSYVGDYVAKLKNFVESYRTDYPFQDGTDVAVVSIRDELLSVRDDNDGQCQVSGANLLYSTQDPSAEYSAWVPTVGLNGLSAQFDPEVGSVYPLNVKPAGDGTQPGLGAPKAFRLVAAEPVSLSATASESTAGSSESGSSETAIGRLPVTSDLAVHLDASALTGYADGDFVARWPDLTGQTSGASASSSVNSPRYAAAAGDGYTPALWFDNVDDRLDFYADESEWSDEMTGVFVVTTGAPSERGCVWDTSTLTGAGAPGAFRLTHHATRYYTESWNADGAVTGTNAYSVQLLPQGSATHVVVVRGDRIAGVTDIRVDGSAWEVQDGGFAGTFLGGRLGGTVSGDAFEGGVHEVLLYRRSLSDSEVAQLTQHMRNKHLRVGSTAPAVLPVQPSFWLRADHCFSGAEGVGLFCQYPGTAFEVASQYAVTNDSGPEHRRWPEVVETQAGQLGLQFDHRPAQQDSQGNVLYYETTDIMYAMPAAPYDGGYTVFVVAQPADTASSGWIGSSAPPRDQRWNLNSYNGAVRVNRVADGTWQNVPAEGAAPVGAPFVAAVVGTDAGRRIWIDGAPDQAFDDLGGPINLQQLRLGWGPMNGILYEAMVFNEPLGDAQVDQVNAYLMERYLGAEPGQGSPPEPAPTDDELPSMPSGAYAHWRADQCDFEGPDGRLRCPDLSGNERVLRGLGATDPEIVTGAGGHDTLRLGDERLQFLSSDAEAPVTAATVVLVGYTSGPEYNPIWTGTHSKQANYWGTERTYEDRTVILGGRDGWLGIQQELWRPGVGTVREPGGYRTLQRVTEGEQNPNPEAYSILTATITLDNFSLYLNGARLTGPHPSRNRYDGVGLENMVFGSYRSTSHEFSEVLVFDRVLRTGDLDALHSYLGERYDIDVHTNVTQEPMLAQTLHVEEGRYWFSWYQQASQSPASVEVIHADGVLERLAPVTRRAVGDALPNDTSELAPGQEVEPFLRNGWVRHYASIRVDHGGPITIGFVADGDYLLAGPQLEEARDFLEPGPTDFFATTDVLTQPFSVCEDTDGSEFRSSEYWSYGCEYYCPPGTGNDCAVGGNTSGLPQRCFRELHFNISQEEIEKGKLIPQGGFAAGNFNYRTDQIAINLVGTAVKNCELSELPSACHANNFLQYTLRHDGPFRVRNYDGDVYHAPIFPGTIQQAKGLLAERYITNPISSADRNLLTDYWRREFRGRPLDGNYTLRIYETDGLDWTALEDVQLVLNYRYWTRFE